MSTAGPHRFEVRLRSTRVQKELDAVPHIDRRRILATLQALSAEPRPMGCEKLYDSVYRVRVGQWRIIYLVADDLQRVDIGGIRRRNERTYRRVEDMFG
ncbi:MAG: type II toxin-antitoxin system RelE/ParE family toxin [Dehalococcoidia bacterium]